MKGLIAVALLTLATIPATAAEDAVDDIGWPRQVAKDGTTLVYYQPQVDEWTNFADLTFRIAISLTPPGGKEAIGVVSVHGHTDVDNDEKMVLIKDLKITQTHFPGLDAASAEKMDGLVKTFLPPSVTISLHRLVASVQKPSSVSGVPVKNDPPQIFVSISPAILLAVDGKATLAEIPKTTLDFVVNTTWPLFFDRSGSAYYLLVGQQWLTANSLDGPWSATTALPRGMTTVADDPQWASLKNAIPPAAASSSVVPKVYYSSSPAEVILFDGKPVYAQIPGTELLYSTNTSSYLFLHTAANQYYYLTGGRWFRASSLQGPWAFATTDLPHDFAEIPRDSPAAVILASVPGTDEAKDAVLLAQIPTTMTIDPAKAAANVKVSYGGDPQFAPISGTPLTYATNTQDKVIKAGDVYYLCLQGVWFLSTTPQGPWTVASSVPQVIYTIPPSSPVYNVTYVTQTTVAGGSVESSYTAGYMGAFVVGAAVGAIIANGSGYYYPPYVYRPVHGYPRYYPHPHTYGYYGSYGSVAHYNSSTGAYGVSRTVAGPYGSATRGASYNPYTGTSARGATASTAYGSRSAGRAYNPYTGAYAATRQGSSPTAQWGQSVVSRGNQSAYTKHYTTSQGTVASARTASGGKAIGASTANGRAVAGRTASGDMYASRDGNIYKNTGAGWQNYNNGSWNNVPAQPRQQPATANQRSSSANQAMVQQRTPSARQQASTPAARSARSSAAPSPQLQGLQQEAQNRQRGAQQSMRFAQAGGGRAAAGARRR